LLLFLNIISSSWVFLLDVLVKVIFIPPVYPRTKPER